jgi:hypothetical protein
VPEACGGDLVGVWKVTGLCADYAPALLSPSLRLPAVSASETSGAERSASFDAGTAFIEFSTDGEYTRSGTLQMAARYVFKQSCLDAMSRATVPSTASRIDVCNGLSATIAFSANPECSFTDTCRCDVSGPVAFTGTGAYRTENAHVFFDDDKQGGAYCVQDKTAWLYARPLGIEGRLDLTRYSNSSSSDAGL